MNYNCLPERGEIRPKLHDKATQMPVLGRVVFGFSKVRANATKGRPKDVVQFNLVVVRLPLLVG